MTAQVRSTLKSSFETGDVPTGSDYTNMIDSAANLVDTTAQQFTSDIYAPRVSASTLQVNSFVCANNDVYVSGKIIVNQTMEVRQNISGDNDAYVSGRIRSDTGDAILTQAATVNAQTHTAAAQLFTIPTGADILNIFYTRISNEFATAAADLALQIGTSADADQFATFAVSGGSPSWMDLSNARATNVSGASLHAVPAANCPIFAKIVAGSGAVTSKDALISVTYRRRN